PGEKSSSLNRCRSCVSPWNAPPFTSYTLPLQLKAADHAISYELGLRYAAVISAANPLRFLRISRECPSVLQNIASEPQPSLSWLYTPSTMRKSRFAPEPRGCNAFRYASLLRAASAIS